MPPPDPTPSVHSSPTPEPIEEAPKPLLETEPDEFGVFRRYYRDPMRKPDEAVDDLVDSPDIEPQVEVPKEYETPGRTFRRALGKVVQAAMNWFAPFLNPTVFRIMHWTYTQSHEKSHNEMNRLVHNVMRAPDFNADDLEAFKISREEKRLDSTLLCPEGLKAEGWRPISVKVPLPKEKSCHESIEEVPTITIDGIWMHTLENLICELCRDESVHHLNFIPFELWHRDPDTGEETCMYSEIYNSKAMLEEDAKIHAQPRNPEDGPTVEYVVMPVVFYSDSTQLADFGTASLWPLYFWNYALSKYVNGKQSNFAVHHVAYIPSLPDILQDYYRKVYELMHAIWLILLDADFMHAYKHGILVECADRVVRRIFPRIFAYSSDYPERFAGMHLISRKLLVLYMSWHEERRTRHGFHAIARACNLIFFQGLSMHSKRVEDILKPQSLLPTRSAFSLRLAPLNVNHYLLFKPDLMHEFELGVWKAIFIHILRLLQYYGGSSLTTLNERFRCVPTFGRGTICKFSANVSEMKQFAAHNYENVLQCIISCLEGLLLAPMEQIVFDMIWFLLVWHALAKLRLHTEATVGVFRGATRHLGRAVRKFERACAPLDTQELPKETTAREKRMTAKVNAKGKVKVTADQGAQEGMEAVPGLYHKTFTHLLECCVKAGDKSQAECERLVKKTKKLNLKMFKWHDLPHFPDQIPLTGPTDIYSTQAGESEHKRVKGWYGLINKNNHEGQIAMKQQRQKALMDIKKRDVVAIEACEQAEREQAENATRKDGQKTKRPRFQFRTTWEAAEDEELGKTRFNAHHHIADSQRYHEDIFKLNDTNSEDPALRNFVSDLKDHFLARILGMEFNGEEHEFTDEQRVHINVVNDRIYRHQILRVNYTTYDMCRDQDTLNPRMHADFMVLNPGEDDLDECKRHPYWYGRVCGVFHAYVQYTGPGYISKEKRQMEFLWVRWFGRDLKAPGGFATRRLHRLGFVDADEPGTFGFLDPSLVICAVHLIPAFHHRCTQDLLGPSILRRELEKDEQEDWKYYYMDMFVDRDMIMRYLGGGIGHVFLCRIIDIVDVFCYFFKVDSSTKGGKNDSAEVDEGEEEAYGMEDEAVEDEELAGNDDPEDTDNEDGEEDEDEDEESDPEGEEGDQEIDAA
ncbi:hypothetical protein NM688_g6018 [Phlebia brevispora]|uniref:Uncharacterized protein n=1 Tax=Phlebia brevispora TaxID=194682 RepID=A0ACC1SL99_9APHY|nr:hypothetical protein NM688_g6018 [Phlebia brevispora]